MTTTTRTEPDRTTTRTLVRRVSLLTLTGAAVLFPLFAGVGVAAATVRPIAPMSASGSECPSLLAQVRELQAELRQAATNQKSFLTAEIRDLETQMRAEGCAY